MKNNALKLIVAAGLALCAASTHAGPYYDLRLDSSSATLKLSGDLKVAASSATPNTPTITLKGSNGVITATSLTGNVTGNVTGNLTGNVTGNVSGSAGSTTGNAATATMLAANGANCTAGSYPLGVDASGAVEGCTSSAAAPVDTRQVFLSGSGTYTTPALVRQIKIRMVGGGGGGSESGSGSNPGTVGGASSFNSITAGGGAPGYPSSDEGPAPVAGTGSASVRMFGGPGGIGGAVAMGGQGGNSALGGGARPRLTGVGFSAGANTGGGGGSNRWGASGVGGQGGGGGEYVEIRIPSPAATYSYAVGAGGAGGTGTSTDDGGAGGSGIIIVDESY